jgi:hypothetical protein
MTNIDQKKIQRFKYLKHLYDVVDGKQGTLVNMFEVGKELGFDEHTTDGLTDFLRGEGLIKFWAMGGTIGITHLGIKQVEQAQENPQQATKFFPPYQFVFTADFRGAILNVDSTLTNVQQSISNSHMLDESAKRDLVALFAELRRELDKLPSDNAEEAEAIALTAEELMNSTTGERPNKVKLKISMEGLIRAAQNVAQIAAPVLTVAERIVEVIRRVAAS